jgi:hypothetical protein
VWRGERGRSIVLYSVISKIKRLISKIIKRFFVVDVEL